MKISQEELQRRLNSGILNKLLTKDATAEIPSCSEEKSKRGNDENNRNNAGRLPDAPNAPESLRKVAGILAHAEGNSSQVSRNLELSAGQVRYAACFAEEKITERQVQELALTRTMDALGLLTIDTISGEKPKDIASIAANLSRVHSNLRSRDAGDSSRVSVNIYSPKQRTLDDYEVIEVKTGT